MRISGVTVFFTDPGKAEDCQCVVCDTKCVVKHNLMGSTCWVGSMAGHKKLHDHAECPHCDERWHDQACELWKEAQNTHSKRVRSLIESDLIDILTANGKVNSSPTTTS